ncbi:MAG: DUF2079 domain-containing protein [Salibacteraceae bacterium]
MSVTSKVFTFLKANKYPFLISLLFGIIYSLISFVNHYQFRTYGADLGIYTNALYDYIHFQWNDSTSFLLEERNLLADHFDLYLILFSPLSLLFGAYTLLIVQIIALILGGFGVYSFLKVNRKPILLPVLGMIYFYSFFGVFGAVSYDYHSNVVAAAMVPWFFCFVKKRKLVYASLILSFILIGKENMSLWMVFVCFGLLVIYWKDSKLKLYLFFSAVVCVFYFVVVSSTIMPSFTDGGSFSQFKYAVLGNSPSEAFWYLLSHPLDSFKILFVNHNNSEFGNFVKLETHLILLFCGLPFLLWRPQYMVMLIPIYVQKLFHNNSSMWGVNDQYNIEFAPIMAMGIFMVLEEIKNKKLQKVLAIGIVVMGVGASIRTMDNTVQWSDKSKIRFYQARHYKRHYNVNDAHRELSKLPINAIISAQGPFVPHVAYRDKVYQFPVIKDAEYIVFSDNEDYYVTSKNEFKTVTDSLRKSENWVITYDNAITILRKNHD